MAKGVKIKLNRRGVSEFLRGEETRSILREHTDAIAARAGADYRPSVWRGKRRMHGRVKTTTEEAYRENLRDNTLLRALGGS